MKKRKGEVKYRVLARHGGLEYSVDVHAYSAAEARAKVEAWGHTVRDVRLARRGRRQKQGRL